MDIIPYLNDLMLDMFMHIVCIVCVIVFFFVILPTYKAIDCKCENLWCDSVTFTSIFWL